MHERYREMLAQWPALPHPSAISYVERRQASRDYYLHQPPLAANIAEVRDITLPLPGREVRTRLYVPEHESHGALVIYAHGGSFVEGDLDTHDALVRRLASDTHMRFLAVDYALAPESPFPAGLHDIMDTVRYVARNHDAFDVLDAPLLLMGDSAGACLVAVAAVELRHEDLGVVGQVLAYPTLGPEVVTKSSHDYATGFLLEMDYLRADYAQYLQGVTDHTDPRVTPLFYGDVAGAPPAIVVVAEFDPLRDEGITYAGLLEHSGVRVEVLEAKGMLHGFLRHGNEVPDALDILDDVAAHMAAFVAVTK